MPLFPPWKRFPEPGGFHGKDRRSVGRLTHANLTAAGFSAMAIAMTEAANDDDYEEEEDYGPSLAYPPLYVLRTAARCPECGEALHVYAIGCTAFRDAEDGGEPIDQFHFLHHLRSLPEPLLALLKAKAPGFYPDQAGGEGTPYLTNHCPCGARLDDEHLHGDVGAAFWPDTEEGYGGFRLFRLPVEEPIPVECSLTIGGGEYLNFAQAEAW
jgi:hypothetical protein